MHYLSKPRSILTHTCILNMLFTSNENNVPLIFDTLHTCFEMWYLTGLLWQPQHVFGKLCSVNEAVAYRRCLLSTVKNFKTVSWSNHSWMTRFNTRKCIYWCGIYVFLCREKFRLAFISPGFFSLKVVILLQHFKCLSNDHMFFFQLQWHCFLKSQMHISFKQ